MRKGVAGADTIYVRDDLPAAYVIASDPSHGGEVTERDRERETGRDGDTD